MIRRLSIRRLFSTVCAKEVESTSQDSNKVESFSFVETTKTKYAKELEGFSSNLIKLRNQSVQTMETSHKEFLKMMRSSILTDNCTVVPVGSMANGLCFDISDLDLVFVPCQTKRTAFLREFHKSFGFREQFMFSVFKLIEREMAKHDVSIVSSLVIPKGRVPLIALNFSNGVKVDIQFPDGNFHAIRNTYLIRTYTQCDERLSLLYFWLRHTAKALDVLNGKAGGLSSYHLLLLTIHFLQSEKCLTPWPILPVLCLTHPHLVGKNLCIDDVIQQLDQPNTEIEWQSRNKMPIHELILRFVDYYSTFRTSESAIYIDTGRVSRRKHVSDPNTLQIFDPYSRLSVCRSPYASAALIEAINFVKTRLKNGQMISSLSDMAEDKSIFLQDTRWRPWRVHMEDMKKQLQNDE